MTNADLFKQTFGIYAEEFWSFDEKQMLDWLNANVPDRNVGDLISRRDALDAIKAIQDYNDGMVFETLSHALRDIELLPSAQKNGNIDEAVKYIKSTQEYLTDIGETWYADYLSDAIDLLVGERGEDGF